MNTLKPMPFAIAIILSAFIVGLPAWAGSIRPGKLLQGVIELDHGTVLKGEFKVVPYKDFFTIEPAKFKARIYHHKNASPKEQIFTAQFYNFEKETKFVEKYRLKITNEFQNGMNLVLTHDQRLILMDLELDDAKVGTVIFLKDHVYKNYQGSLVSFNFDGPGRLELKDGTVLWGEFKHGTMSGAMINPKTGHLYIYRKDKLMHEFKMQKKVCRDPYLGNFQVHKGDCGAPEFIAHAINFENKLGVINGKFKNGKIIQGEIFTFSPWSLGTIAKINEGKPVDLVRTQSKDGLTVGNLHNGKYEGQVLKVLYKNGHKYIEFFSGGKKNGAFRHLNENNEVLEKGVYRNELKEGEVFTYYGYGKLKTIQTFKNGKVTGKTVYFDQDGKISHKKTN